MRRSLFALLLVASLQVGCERAPSPEEIRTRNGAIATEVKAETGHEALLGIMADGSKVTITVTLIANQADTDTAKPRIEAIVRKHWPKVAGIEVKSQAP